LPVVLLAPLVLHEYITPLQSVGIACAIAAIVLLSLPSKMGNSPAANGDAGTGVLTSSS